MLSQPAKVYCSLLSACALLLTSVSSAQPSGPNPELREKLKTAKTVRIVVKQDYTWPNDDAAEEDDSAENKKDAAKAQPKQPKISLPLAQAASDIFGSFGVKAIASDDADLVLQVDASFEPVSGIYETIGTQYTGASLSGAVSLSQGEKELTSIAMEFEYHRSEVVTVSSYGGFSTSVFSRPEGAPFTSTLPGYYRALMELGSEFLDADVIARALTLKDPIQRAVAVLIVANSEPNAADADVRPPGTNARGKADLRVGRIHPELAAKLAPLLRDESREVRAAAAWGLAQIGGADSVPKLIDAIEASSSWTKLPEIVLPNSDDDEYSAFVDDEERPSLTDYPESIFQRGFGGDADVLAFAKAAVLELGNRYPAVHEILIGELKAKNAERRANAAMLLAEFKRPEAREPLEKLLGDTAPAVRALAVKALGTLAIAKSASPLMEATLDSDPYVRSRARDAVSNLVEEHRIALLQAGGHAAERGKKLSRESLYSVAKSTDPVLRWIALDDLPEPTNAAEWDILGSAIQDRYPLVRSAALAIAARTQNPGPLRNALISALRDPEGRMRAAIISELGRLKDPELVEVLVPFITDSRASVRATLMTALPPTSDPRCLTLLIAGLHDGGENVRENAIDALALTSNPHATGVLLAFLISEPHVMPELVVEALARRKDSSAAGPLIKLLAETASKAEAGNYGAEEFASEINNALKAITGKKFRTAAEWSSWSNGGAGTATTPTEN